MPPVPPSSRRARGHQGTTARPGRTCPARPAPSVGRRYIADQDFSYEIRGGYGEATLEFRNLDLGTYEVWLGGKTAKTGGAWFEGVGEDAHRYSRVQIHPIRLTISK
ncbi:hypothetical protein [Streptomyces sp. SAS_272]|uniref:hypothetical protein n=1 Tax=Streptomyces sp. SAS_272 TaxID=3412747 RepID=UPI00403D248D